MAFVDTALERFTKVAPELSRFIVTFYDMTEELPEESGINVGVIILVLGTEQYYVPVVATGNTVYPIDSIYSQSTGKFSPLVKKTYEALMLSSQSTLGKPSAIPPTVNKNPSVQELVEPPKTGKHVYSGTMLPEALAQMSPEGKRWFLEKISSEQDLMKRVHACGVDVRSLFSAASAASAPALSKTADITITIGGQLINDHEDLDTDAPVRVIENPEPGLEDEMIQQVLQKGYAIIGDHPVSRVAVEYSKTADGLTTLSAGVPGNAYEVMMDDGTSAFGFVPDMLREIGLGETLPSSRNCGSSNRRYNTTLIMEDGTYFEDTNEIVIRSTPRPYAEILKHMVEFSRFKSLADLMSGDKIFVVTPKGFSGPFTVRKTSWSAAGGQIAVWGPGKVRSIFVSPNVKGDAVLKGEDLYVSPACVALMVSSCSCDAPRPARNINQVLTKQEMSAGNLVKEAHILAHDGVEYFYDGKLVGGIAKIAKVLAVDEGLDPHQVAHFIKRAQEDRRIVMKMSKKAEINGVGMEDNEHPHDVGRLVEPPHELCEVPTHGVIPPLEDGRALSERKVYMYGKYPVMSTDIIKEAAVTGDSQIVEASVMSEILKDSAMGETISSYLPIIDEAIDKLGRILLLLRIKNTEMLERMSPEGYAALTAALRNTYRMLGENKLTLEQMVANEQGIRST